MLLVRYFILFIFTFHTLLWGAPGDLDAQFGVGGTTVTPIGSGHDYGENIAVQNDGKIVVVGQSDNGSNFDMVVVRYNADGFLDTSFGTSGKVITNLGTSHDRAYGVVIQSDGKIIAAGRSYNGSRDDFAVVRYNTDGSLDTTFGTGGSVTTALGTFNSSGAYNVGLQSDGKIIAVGYRVIGSNFDFALVRYNTDGSLDTTFGTGGIVTTAVGSGNDVIEDVVIQSDGKIVAVGRSTIANEDFALARYNTDGSLDTTFGTGGIVTTDVGSINSAFSATLQSDGKIIAAGRAFINGPVPDFALIRYNTDGSLDTTFGTGGIVTTDVAVASTSDFAQSVTLQNDGKIIAAGYGLNGTDDDIALVRYNTDGSLDTSFGTGGKVLTPVGSSNDYASSVTIQNDGKIILTGRSSNGNDDDFVIARYLASTPLPLLKTGQTKCYDNSVEIPCPAEGAAFYGQDAQYAATVGVARSYTRDPATGIVTDNATGLQWQDDYDGNPATTSDATPTKQWVTTANYSAGNYFDTSGDTATTYCSTLSLGGHSDWRLPTLKELEGLTDKGRVNPALFMESMDSVSNNGFVHAVSSSYWSSTTYASPTYYAWLVRFNYGSTGAVLKNGNLYVRCVRSGQ